MQAFTVRTTEQLPQLLKAFRKNAGLTQADVALRLGVTQQTVSALERNAEAVSAARLMKLPEHPWAWSGCCKTALSPPCPRRVKPATGKR